VDPIFSWKKGCGYDFTAFVVFVVVFRAYPFYDGAEMNLLTSLLRHLYALIAFLLGAALMYLSEGCNTVEPEPAKAPRVAVDTTEKQLPAPPQPEKAP
jgi:hypothetical protein